MKKLILCLSTVVALLVTGCALKRDCDLKKENQKCKSKKSHEKKTIKKNSNVYLGE